MTILEQIKAISGDSPWLVPSRIPGRHMVKTSVDHAVRKNLPLFGIGQFTPHDLRRTAASLMTGMGIPRLVVSKLLNHVESGITAVYDRHSYDAEKRVALDAWGRKLESIVTGRPESNVVQLRIMA
ncbi:MAG: tyrosine-type recombinase/integrase [Magnetococcus sp. DMHC-8]